MTELNDKIKIKLLTQELRKINAQKHIKEIKAYYIDLNKLYPNRFEGNSYSNIDLDSILKSDISKPIFNRKKIVIKSIFQSILAIIFPPLIIYYGIRYLAQKRYKRISLDNLKFNELEID